MQQVTTVIARAPLVGASLTGTWVFGALLLSACAGPAAESELSAMPTATPVCVAPLPDTVPPAPAVADSFWTHQGEDDATRPAPRPSRSISLGYAGDEPLAGSVMRDTPMEPWTNNGERGMTWQQYQRQPSWPPPREPSPNVYRPMYRRW